MASRNEEEEQLIKSVVVAAFPDETELLGQAVLDQAVSQRDNAAAPVQVRGGHDFDLKPILETIKAAIELTVALIAFYRTFADKGKTPAAEEIIAKAPGKIATGPLKQTDKMRIAEQVIKHKERRR